MGRLCQYDVGSLRSLWSWCVEVYGRRFSWWFQWDHWRACQPSAAGDIPDLVKRSLGGLRGLWSGCVGCLWMCLCMMVPMIPPLALDIPPSHGGSPISLHLCHHMRLYTLTSTCGERRVIKVAISSWGWLSHSAITSSESSFLCQCRPLWSAGSVQVPWERRCLGLKFIKEKVWNIEQNMTILTLSKVFCFLLCFLKLLRNLTNRLKIRNLHQIPCFLILLLTAPFCQKK